MLLYTELCPYDEVDYRYEGFPDSMGPEERRERILDIMLCERICDHDPVDDYHDDYPDVPSGEFEYVHPGCYLSIPHPPIDSLVHPSPYVFRVRGNWAYSEGGTTMCAVPQHYIDSQIRQLEAMYEWDQKAKGF